MVTWSQGQVEARIVERMRPQSSHWSTKPVGCAVLSFLGGLGLVRNGVTPLLQHASHAFHYDVVDFVALFEGSLAKGLIDDLRQI